MPFGHFHEVTLKTAQAPHRPPLLRHPAAPPQPSCPVEASPRTLPAQAWGRAGGGLATKLGGKRLAIPASTASLGRTDHTEALGEPCPSHHGWFLPTPRLFSNFCSL